MGFPSNVNTIGNPRTRLAFQHSDTIDDLSPGGVLTVLKQGCRSKALNQSRQTLVSPIFRSILVPSGAACFRRCIGKTNLQPCKRFWWKKKKLPQQKLFSFFKSTKKHYQHAFFWLKNATTFMIVVFSFKKKNVPIEKVFVHIFIFWVPKSPPIPVKNTHPQLSQKGDGLAGVDWWWPTWLVAWIQEVTKKRGVYLLGL